MVPISKGFIDYSGVLKAKYREVRRSTEAETNDCEDIYMLIALQRVVISLERYVFTGEYLNR